MSTLKDEILAIAAKYGFVGDLFLHRNGKVYMQAYDDFYPEADARVEITITNSGILHSGIQALTSISADSVTSINTLFCAAVLELRPQNGRYNSLPTNVWSLFDAVGTERSISSENPYVAPSDTAAWAARDPEAPTGVKEEPRTKL